MNDYVYLLKKKIRRDKMVRELMPFLYFTLACSLLVLGVFLGSLLEEMEMLHLIAR